MTTTVKSAKRAEEIAAIRERVQASCAEVLTLVGDFPETGNLVTWRALDNTMSRAVVAIREYIAGDTYRREHRERDAT